ncbi:capsule assembly Wzi family protein [Tatumella sp. JGM100]|nr:capsule assembly Wzi family protein [Tatumella sp. JGM82]MBS0891938.1 capsule assembly Wzi family protein [Tatumella sp. JGM94]MBS0900552.1 capsule assembly Wzi family protein [Tatumella sp. JGM100]
MHNALSKAEQTPPAHPRRGAKKSLMAMMVGLTLLPAASSFAGGLVLPDSDLRSDLSWLADRGVIRLSLSTWPLSEDAIEAALEKAHPAYSSEQLAIERVQQRLRTLKSDVRINGYTSTGGSGQPKAFAQSVTADNRLSVISSNSGDWWDINLQGNLEAGEQIQSPSRANLNNSYAAVKIWGQWLSFGQTPQWWGPGNEGSLIRSDAARPLTGFMLQRDRQTAPDIWWLNWVGPWQYQISAAQEAQYTAVPHTKIIGMRLSVSPWQSLELGASRIMQWGGEGRPQSLNNFWDGFAGNDNTTANDPNEPGNQLAGFDARLKLEPTLGIPVSIYGQLIGEDEAGKLPSSNMYLLGIEGHQSLGKNAVNWYLEGHDTRTDMSRTNYSYTHHIYKDGYYQQGYPLGDSLGGDGRLLAAKTELVTEDNQRWSVRMFYARVNPENQRINRAFPHADTLKGVQLGWGGAVYKSVRLNLSSWYTDASHNDNNDLGASAALEIPFQL